MTTLLETAFEKISALPEIEQNIYAKNILDELEFTYSDVYVKNKEELEGVLSDIEDGTATLLPHDEVWSKIEAKK
jgi:hypothetical protein